jgi:hypothetical protein
MTRMVGTSVELTRAITERRPAVWPGAVLGTSELQGLRMDALKMELGDKPVRLCRTLDGIALISYARHPRDTTIEAPIGEIEREPVYLSQVATSQLGLRIESAAANLWPKLGTGIKTTSVNLWVGGRDIGSPLHYDMSGNVMVQVEGEKDVYFAPPDAVENVVLADNTWASHVALGITGNLDVEKVRLRAGDAFYLPAEWFHTTRNRSLGVMVNYWFREELATKLTIRRLAKYFSASTFRILHLSAGSPHPPWALHERSLAALTTRERRIAAFLLAAKLMQETVSALPSVRDTLPIGPDLDSFRELLVKMKNHIEGSLWADLVHYFDETARVIEGVLASEPNVDLESVALSAVSRRLDAYVSELASHEVQNSRLRVTWKDMEERMELVRTGSSAA